MNKKNINFNDILAHSICRDGSFDYRALSHYFHKTGEYYNNYKQIIAEYLEQNIDNYIDFFEEDPINNFSQKEVAADYVKKVYKDGTYAGNVEMLATAYLFKINIAVYQLNTSNYSLYTTIKVNENYEYIVSDYINNNHFSLIYPKYIDYSINNNKEILKR